MRKFSWGPHGGLSRDTESELVNTMKRALMFGIALLLGSGVAVFSLGVLGAPEPPIVEPISLGVHDDSAQPPVEGSGGGTDQKEGGGAIPAPPASPVPAGEDDNDNDDGTKSNSDNTDGG